MITTGRRLENLDPAAHAQAERYFTALAAGLPRQWLLELRALGRPRVMRRWFRLDRPGEAAAWCVRHSRDGFDVYAGVQPRHTQRGGASAVAAIIALYADLDCGRGKALASKTEACNRLESLALLGLRPSLVIDSGGGLHSYWLLREPLHPDGHLAWRDAMRALAHSLSADPSVTDLPRILRVPETLNWKQRENPRRVSWLSFEPERRFNLLDFDELLPEQPLARDQQAPPLGRAATGANRRVRAAIDAAGLRVREKRDGAGKLVALVLRQACPLCPGPPAQAAPPRPGSAHIAPLSGTLRCKRSLCAAGAIATGTTATGEPRGLALDHWIALLTPAPHRQPPGVSLATIPRVAQLPRMPSIRNRW